LEITFGHIALKHTIMQLNLYNEDGLKLLYYERKDEFLIEKLIDFGTDNEEPVDKVPCYRNKISCYRRLGEETS
jgi:hypothetical protein